MSIKSHKKERKTLTYSPSIDSDESDEFRKIIKLDSDGQ